MKNVITFLMCSLCIITGIAQTDLAGDSTIIPQRTPELDALYQQAKALEQNGTAAEINANRLAIKDAWQDIDANVAALYKPIVTNRLPETVENLSINGVYIPSEIFERDGTPDFPEDWDTDRLLRDDYIDAVDMDVTAEGDIYIGVYENIIDFGGTFDSIFLYRSVDAGITFQEWKKVGVTAPMRKMQIISMDGDGDDYLLAYLVTESENFQAWRWNMATGAFDAQVIASDVTDFGVDRNYPLTTATQRCFATYEKTTGCTEVFSARTSTGTYGFGWTDEVSLGLCGQQVEFTYGINGACYTTFTGANSGSLYAAANTNYNDPASWDANENIINGATTEVLNPTIRAARLPLPSDKVIIWASQRAAGSTDNYNGLGLKRINSAPYANFSNFPSGGADWNIAHTDSWMRKDNNIDVIRTSYIRDNISDTQFDTNRSLTFNGTDFDPFEPVVDAGINAFDGFAAASAETGDNLPCLAFAGTSGGGTFGFGLYFDAKTVLAVDENNFEGFKFYPNPAQDILNLSATNTIERVSIFSLLGQKIMETSPNQDNPSINVASLSQGVYLMKVMIDGKSATYKIIKQ
ncbi:T9SS type A sorting domain-containing protein [Aequorivita sp. CIP111184]|uniref:T9SS type A sorting domain-containing protein n=1 Tax=Aequorivita sp. CIP111184 TaxID=2211356 RepID=UPI000DBC109C|nr:T9SS type A sorting domain-containing protein [Aequorivita sp. CIP111184]SRX52770.1 hypothetical protein AEQU1_00640 [Aequorivita sp. CIP111184]